MFNSLPHVFKKHRLNADVRTLLSLRKAMDKGLVNTLGDIYVVLRGLITSAPSEYGPFGKAFYEYFLSIDIKPGESLENAIIRSDAFNEWRQIRKDREKGDEEEDILGLVEEYLDEIHLTTFDIKKILDGKSILAEDDVNLEDNPNPDQENAPGERRPLDRAADYSDVPLEEILERMREIAKKQRDAHQGGSHWIGQNGVSPYGNGGAAKGGVRVGGTGGGKMARKVMGDRNFYPVDRKEILKDDNIDAALAALKGIQDESADKVLDIPKTIDEGLKQGGIFLPYEKDKINQKLQVILMIDNGGYSMHPYIRYVTKLFSKMKTRFAHDLKVYYYHNTIYGGAYTDAARSRFEKISKILKNDKNYSVFIVGDADMAPWELDESSLRNWMDIQKRFKRTAWLNPMQERWWNMSTTAQWIQKVIPMYTLTPEGIEKAVVEMNKKLSKRSAS